MPEPRPSNTVSRMLANRLAPVSVLIADADVEIAHLVRNVLRTVGFINIRIATDGNDAIELIRNNGIDLLITDWRIEGMDGMSLLRFLRSDVNSPNKFLPVIMLTGRAERRDVETARDAGVTEYLVKPFTAKALFERIVQVIENPRSFILAKNYKGPDRRRQVTTPEGDERRVRRPRPKAAPKNNQM